MLIDYRSHLSHLRRLSHLPPTPPYCHHCLSHLSSHDTPRCRPHNSWLAVAAVDSHAPPALPLKIWVVPSQRSAAQFSQLTSQWVTDLVAHLYVRDLLVSQLE